MSYNILKVLKIILSFAPYKHFKNKYHGIQKKDYY